MNPIHKNLATAAATVICCLTQASVNAEDLAKTFANPPETAGPQTWWHWMNGNITKEGITADLEAMKHVGIHGAEIFNVEEGIPLGDAPFMSPQWLEMFRHAASEADRLGMELCFHNCAGWSSSGGPWVKPEHAMQTLVTSEIKVKGGTHVSVLVPQPPEKAGYYKDIAVMAFPTPTNATRIEKLEAKGSFGFAVEYGLQPDLKLAPAGAVIPHGKIVDLTSKTTTNGLVTWDAPEGNWTILRIGHTPTGKSNHPSPKAGLGLECDKLSREALDEHWAGGIDPILKKLGPLAGRSLNNCLIDSYEVGCNNWTPRFREEFIKRRGYDPIPWLPVLSGRFVESGELSERFLWDFRRTIGDLFSENYYGYFCDLCRKHGLMASIEPYDGPYECLQVGAKADILMGEFWAGSGGESSSVKLAASVAHTHDIRIVGAESFTADPENGRWLNHPASLKALGDLTWCTGVNRFIFHCYAHQPWMDKVPGMTMGQWGTHFGRFNTWWEQSRPWIQYITRSQYLLQNGHNVADVLFFGGEASPNGGPHHPDLKQRGYDYDAIGTDLIYQLKVDGNRVVTPSGASYRLLVMPESEWMTPALVSKVGELVRNGATVLSPKPLKSPSLHNYPACDAEVAKLADEIWGGTPLEHSLGKGRIIPNRQVEEVLNSIKLKPDCAAVSQGSKISFIHRKIGNADVYFVSNQRGMPDTVSCAFRITGSQPELWNAETGEAQAAPVWNAQDEVTTVTLNLDQTGSMFVVFRAPIDKQSGDPVVQLTVQPDRPMPIKLPKLVIKRAVYGAFTLNGLGMVDITSKLETAVRDNRLDIVIGNQLGGDPAQDVFKKARVEYECGGKTNLITLDESARLVLPRQGETGELRIIRGVYGKITNGLTGFPPLRFKDITKQVASKVQDGMLAVIADNALAGEDPATMTPKTLRIDYTLDGEPQSLEIPEHTELLLPEHAFNLLPPKSYLTSEKAQLKLHAAEPGKYILNRKSGESTTVTVADVPASVEVTGPWKVNFQTGRGAPAEATFDDLISWPLHQVAGIKYFSGTATYHKKINIPENMLGDNKSIQLDLGRVAIIAEVRLNGQELGTLWKAPFRLDVTRAAKAGDNDLEIRVVNLWVNRLIGDEQLPEDCEWNGITLKKWPDWMVQGKPRPTSERITFTTWKHWQRGGKLQTSGLLGPVQLRSWVNVSVK